MWVWEIHCPTAMCCITMQRTIGFACVDRQVLLSKKRVLTSSALDLYISLPNEWAT